MKKFKLYDTWISIILIAGSILYALIRMDYSFLAGYFLVGSWQLVSMFVHIYRDWFIENNNKRKRYNQLVFFIFIGLALGFLVPTLLYIILIFLLFAAPFMAIYYAMLCYNEVYVKMQRPLAILK